MGEYPLLVTAAHHVYRDGRLLGVGRSTALPTVTVVVPNFNNASHLPHLVSSLRREAFRVPLELIIVDDCSIDNSLQVLRQMEDVNVIRTAENSGIDSIPDNIGIARARGSYVAIVDGDDYILTDDSISRMVTALEGDPRAIAASSNVIFQRETRDYPDSFSWMASGGPGGVHDFNPHAVPGGTVINGDQAFGWTRRLARSWPISDQMVFDYYVGLKVIRTEAARLVGGHPAELGTIGNAGLMLRLAVEQELDPSRRIIPVDCDAYVYRVHGSNHSASRDWTHTPYRREVLKAIHALGLTYEDLENASQRQRMEGKLPVIDYWGLTESQVRRGGRSESGFNRIPPNRFLSGWQSTPSVPTGSESEIKLTEPTLPSREAFDRGLDVIWKSGQLTKGSYLDRFEHELAAQLGVRHVVGVSSGTTGLILALLAVGADREVVLPSFTFVATGQAVLMAKATPRFADINLRTTNVDPDAVRSQVTTNTSAILAMHNNGSPADVIALEQIARDAGVPLIFDAAHALGALYNGAPLAAQGDMQVFSLSPPKTITSGEGGFVTTNDDELANIIRSSRDNGIGKGGAVRLGMNGRLAEPLALMALESLPVIEALATKRRFLAKEYRRLLADVPGVSVPEVPGTDGSSYKAFSVLVDPDQYGLTRDQLARHLDQKHRIKTRPYYSPTLHQQPLFAPYMTDPLPITDKVSAQVLCLPMWPGLDFSDVERVASVVSKAPQEVQYEQSTSTSRSEGSRRLSTLGER